MLAAIRSFVRSWVMKVFLGVLVLSFAIWGVGDIFTGGTGNAVARVGDLEVSGVELDDSFRRSLQSLQQQSPNPITRADAIRFGLLEQSLQGLVQQRLLDAEAHRLAVTTADTTVGRLITEEAAFHVDGRFDRERFQNLLRQAGLDEGEFAEGLRGDRTRGAIAGSVRAIDGLPPALTEPLAARLAETRSGEILVVTADRFADLPVPSDAELQAHLDANAFRFQAPERRDIEAVLLAPETLIDEIVVTDDELRAHYDEQIASFTTPEQRTVRQLRGQDEIAVRDAYAALASGEDLEAIADRIDGVALSALGPVTEAGLPQAFADAIFADLDPGDVTPPVESAFGWHVFLIDEVTAPDVLAFADVREELRADLAAEQALVEMPGLATALDDALGGGASLREAANELDLPLVEARGLDATGTTPTGDTFDAFAGWEALVAQAFAAPLGETSLLEQTGDDRYFVFEVQRVEEARPLTLDEARADAIAGWRAEAAQRQADELARRVLADLEGGMEMAEAVTVHGLERRDVPPQTRTESVANPVVQAALFAATPGTLAPEVLQVEDGAAVLRVAAETGRDEEVARATVGEADAGFTRDLQAQFEQALQQIHPIRVDRAALARLFPVEPDQ